MDQGLATLDGARASTRETNGEPTEFERVWSLVERALTLTERLSGAYPPAGLEPAEIGKARYRLWCTRLTGGDDARFERRLQWDGLHPLDVERALGKLRMPRHREFPRWTQLLLEAIDEAREHATVSRPPPEGGEPAPFEEILRPFVEVGTRRIGGLHSGGRRLLHDSAIADLECALLRALSALAARALFVEFSEYRTRKDPFAAMTSVAPGRRVYLAFVQYMLGDGLFPFVERFSMLGRLLATRVMQWCDRTSELLARLEVDYPELQARFHGGRATERVRRIRSDLSDPHDDWRTVCILEFDSGLRVVYKPRSLAPEAGYARLVHWLNSNGAEPALEAADVLVEEGYGWMQYIEASACKDRVAVERYYERAGMLLCLARTLGSGDFHAENVVARGEFPILVDLELVQGARILSEQEIAGSPTNPVAELLWDSVTRTMLLPYDMIGPGGETVQGGGFGGGTPPRVMTLVWRNINTDAMAHGIVEVPALLHDNLPVLEGAVQPPEQYVRALERGFSAMHRLLTARREALLAPGGPLAGPGFDQARVIIRPTQTYAAALARCTHPRFLSHGVDMGIELDVLCRSRISQHEEPPLLWPAFSAERADLERLDIPHFTARTDDEWLRDSSGSRLARYCASSPRTGMIHRLRELDTEDRKRQLRFISLSFRGLNQDRWIRDLEIGGATLSRDDVLREACAIAGHIDSLAYSSRSGRVWYGIVHDADCADLQDLGDGLYLGAAGPAILHAALYATTRESRHHVASMACLERSLRRLTRRRPAARNRMRADGCGIGGLGGITYTLAICTHLLESAELRRATARAAEAMYPPRTHQASPANLVSGSGGAVAALLAAYRLTGNRALLAQAIGWAERLVRDRARDPRSGLLTWRDPYGDFRTGLGKGVAGVVRALADLHLETSRTEFLDTAAEGWAFVDSVQDPEWGGWHTRFGADDDELAPAVQRAWCLGSSGIGLAAAASCQVLAGMVPRIEHALDHRRSLDQAGVIDNCCCGYSGHLDLLLGAGRVLERPDLAAEAHALAVAMARKARRRGSYDTGYGAVYTPGFFKGLAGIGYQLLRLHHADALPSVLLLDSAVLA